MKTTLFSALALFLLAASASAAPDAKAAEGHLGLGISAVPQELRAELGVPPHRGVAVTLVTDGSPAAAAGVRAGDVIVKVNDQLIFSADQLSLLIRSLKPGSRATLGILRRAEGKTEDLSVPVTVGAAAESEKAPGYLGVVMGAVPGILRAHLTPVPEDQGVLVLRVVPESPAAAAGLKRHDVLVKVGDDALGDPAALARAVRKLPPGTDVTLSVVRGNRPRSVTVTLGARPPDDRRVFLDAGELDPVTFLGFQEGRLRLKNRWKDLEAMIEKKLGEVTVPRVQLEGKQDVAVSDGYIVLVREKAGKRTVTVTDLKQGKVIARDLPMDKLDGLPEEVRDIVGEMGRKVGSATIRLFKGIRLRAREGKAEDGADQKGAQDATPETPGKTEGNAKEPRPSGGTKMTARCQPGTRL